MSSTDDLLQNARDYAASFDNGEVPLRPARKVAVLACMDSRMDLVPHAWPGARVTPT